MVRPRRLNSLLCLTLWLVAIDGHAASVLFEQGHGQRFVIERTGELDLSQLAGLFEQQAMTVVSSDQPLDQLRLDQHAMIVISGAFAPFGIDERRALLRYVEQGGRLVVLLHVGPLNGALLADFGVAVSNGVVFDPERATGAPTSDFRVDRLATHPLLQGVEQLKVYGAWALNPVADAESLLNASATAWMDLNRNRRQDSAEPVAPFSLAVIGRRGRGEYIVLGDDAIFQNRYLHAGNRQLAQNLVQWGRSAPVGGASR